MKLYTYDPAPNASRLARFMRYKGIEIETQQVDVMAQEQLGQAYREINPMCTIPALVLDDGTTLTEVIGICTYLEGLHPEKPLLGTTALEKALVSSWVHRLFGMVMMAIADMLRNRGSAFANRALPGPLDLPQIAELVDRGKLRLDFAWPTLNEELADRQWVAGDSPSMADIDLLVGIEFSAWVKQGVPDECSHLLAWQARAKDVFQ